MSHQIFCFFLLLAAVLLLPFAVANEPSYRELHIPEEELPLLLESWPEAMLLSRQEFAALLEQNRQQSEEISPQALAFSRLDCAITVLENRAFLDITLELTVLRDGWQFLVLGGSGIGWQQVNHRDRSAFCSLGEHGELLVQLEKGTHQLHLRGETPVSSDATKRQLVFELPKAATGSLQLEVPGDVVLHSGPAQLSRHFNPETRSTRFRLLPSSGRLELTLSLNNRFEQNERLLLAESQLLCYLSENEERLEAEVELQILHHPLPELRLQISPEYEILAVHAEQGLIASWEIQKVGVLAVQFQKPQSGKISLKIFASRRDCPRPAAWVFPDFHPLDCFSASTSAVLLKHPQLRLDKLRGENLQFVSRQNRSLPAWLAARPDFEYTASFVAPGAFRLQAESIRKAEAELEASLQNTWILCEKQQELQLQLTLTAKVEDLFELELILPGDWQKAEPPPIHLQKQTATTRILPRPDFTLEASGRDKGHFLLRFPNALKSGQTVTLPLAFTAVPENWFRSWDQPRTLQSPVLRLDTVRWRGGVLQIQLQDDLQGKLLNSEKCSPIQQASSGLQAFAFHFPDEPGQATFEVQKILARLSAETYSYYKVDRDHLKVCHEITWQISDAALRQLSFELPAWLPEAISINGETGQICEYSCIRKEKLKHFTVLLNREAAGRERLVIRYQIPQPANGQRLLLPALSAVQAQPFSGRIAIEGQADLEVQIFQAPRKIDSGELATVLNKPGRHLLGVFAFMGNPPPVELLSKPQDSTSLPACLAEQAEAVLLFSPASPRQISVLYTLQTNLPALGIRLPDKASLWSATLDNKPAILLQQEQDFLLQFTSDKSESKRKLLLVFELPAKKITRFGSTTGQLPELFYQQPRLGRKSVPVANVRWTIHYPGNYQPLACFGDVTPRQTLSSPAAAPQLGKLLYHWAGEITPAHGCAGLFFNSLSGARQKAMLIQRSKMASMSAIDTDYVLEETQTDTDGGMDMTKDVHSRKMRPGTAADKSGAKGKIQIAAYRSLDINLVRNGKALHLDALAGDSPFRLLMVDLQAWNALRRVAVLLIFVLGFLPCMSSWSRRLTYIAFLLLGSSLLPLLPGLEMCTSLLNSFFYSALSLLLLYLLLAAGKKLHACSKASALLLFAALLSSAVHAQPILPEKVSDEPPLYRIQNFQPLPIPLPADAVIVPYSGQQQGNRVLLPFEFYRKLQKGAGITTPQTPPFLMSGIQYQCQMGDSQAEHLSFEGHFRVSILKSGPILLPELPFSGMIVEELQINGKAGGRIWQEENDKKQYLRLALSEPGEYNISLKLCCPIRKHGGWRGVKACLPASGASQLLLTELPKNTALSFDSGTGLCTLRTEGKTPSTFALHQNAFSLQWRPETGPAEIDRTLTVDSIIALSLNAQQQQIFWEPAFSFSDQGRSVFDLEIPRDWQVQEIVGNNVRGWEKRVDGERQTISVHLFQPAENKEKFQLILLAKILSDLSAASDFTFPALTVPTAARHQAVLLLDSPTAFMIRSENNGGSRRTDVETQLQRLLTAFPSLQASFRAFEAWESPTQPLQLLLHLLPQQRAQEARLQLLQTITPDAILAEGCFIIKTGLPASVKQSILLPKNFELLNLHAADLLDWQIDPQNPQLVLLRFDGTARLEHKILFRGRARQNCQPGMSLPILAFELQNTLVQHSDLVIQTWEPWQLRQQQLQNLESALLQDFASWLRQRSPSCLAFRSRDKTYSGSLEISPRKQKISGTALLSCKFTEKALEETLLFDLQAEGGIGEFSFQVPEYWHNARPQQPFLRSYETAIVETEGERQVAFTLYFQTALSGQLRILLQQDRQPKTETPVRLPLCDWPLTTCLLLENSGRDEVAAEQLLGLNEWNMQAALPDFLRGLLRGPNRQAWLASESPAGLTFRMQERQAVETAGARIGLSSTLLLLDTAGNCRAEQIFHIDNRTEQYLELELPTGSELWTAKVAGELVKPIRHSKNISQRLLLPLVKTAEGDLDYQIILTYSAHLARPGFAKRRDFPFIKAANINVERSLVELRLPREQSWFDFGGNLGKEVNRENYLSSQLAYQNQQAQRLQQALQSSNVFSQQRAFSNISKLDAALQKNVAEVSAFNQKNAVLQGAQQQLQQLQQQVELTQTSIQASENTREQLFRYNQQQTPTDKSPEEQNNWNPEDFKNPEILLDKIDSSGLTLGKDNALKIVKKERNQPAPVAAPAPSAIRSSEDSLGRVAVEQRQIAKPSKEKLEEEKRWEPELDIAAAASPAAAALNQASLELQLPPQDPQRWQILHFSSPRGVERLYGRSIPRKTLNAWLNLSYTLLISVLILAAAAIFSKHG
ncbi:MAG: hypothetical protein WCT05_10070, partial [Lentisphaeria bacterium]